MIEFSNFSLRIFFVLVVGLPLVAAVSGALQKKKWFFAALVLIFCMMVIALGSLAYLIETGSYPNPTGMEGIVFALVPLYFAGSLVVSVLLFVCAAWISQRRKTD